MLSVISQLEKKARYIRHQVLDMCLRANTGHINTAFSCADILVALYYGGILRFDPQNPRWEERDRFILSKGHASDILSAILADHGFFPPTELDKLNLEDGLFSVHLQKGVPGVEMTYGSLGQGFGVAAGLALAAKMNRQLYMTFVLLGDGECYEGSIWETAMFASHNRLNNLVAILDRNHLCVTDFTENIVALEPLDEKWRSFGWNVKSIRGHSMAEILDALDGFRSRKSTRPLLIIADTSKGKGVSFMCDDPLWHGKIPQGQEVFAARNELKEGR